MDVITSSDVRCGADERNRAVPIPRRWDQPPGDSDVGLAADTPRSRGDGG